MLEINHLNHNFKDRTIFTDSYIKIYENELTIIYGESGSGKSTLMNIMALELDTQADFLFNGIDVNKLSIDEKNQLKRNHILYIHQDDYLVRNYTLKENAKLLVETKGQVFNQKRLLTLMDKVGIEKKKLNKSLSTLSNGERQRFSIICAMMIDAWLYIFDEPTSSLDEKNALSVMKLIKEIANEDKMVVVSLHNQSLVNQGHFYKLENNKINEIKIGISKSANKKYTIEKEKVNKKLLFKESVNHFGHMPIINTFSILVLALVIAFSSVFATYGYQLVPTQTDMLEGIYDNELFVVNSTDTLSVNDYDYDANLSIPKDQVEEIKNTEHVKNIYPHIYLRLQTAAFEDENLRPNILSDEKYRYISLIDNHNEIDKLDYSNDLYMTYLEVNPIYPHHQIENRCEYIDKSISNGLYITADVAQKFGIKELHGQSLKFYTTVFVASDPGVLYDTNNNPNRLVRGAIGVLKEIEIPIKGVLKRTTLNYYNLNEPKILLDYAYIQKIMDETNQENIEWINNAASQEITNSTVREFFPYKIMETKWEPSAYIIEVDSLSNVDKVREDIQKINGDFYVRGLKVNGQLTKDIVNQQKTLFYSFTAALVIVVLVLSFIISYFKKKRNEHYYQFLFKLGYSLKNIQTVILNENLLFMVLILPFTIIFSYLVRNLLSVPAVFNQFFIMMIAIQMVISFLLLNRKYKG